MINGRTCQIAYMSHPSYPSVPVPFPAPSLALLSLAGFFLYMTVRADGIRGGLSGLGVSAGIDRTVPVSPQVAGKYEKMRRRGGQRSAKYSVTMSCAFVVPMGFVCNMGIFLLETQNTKKKIEPWLDFFSTSDPCFPLHI